MKSEEFKQRVNQLLEKYPIPKEHHRFLINTELDHGFLVPRISIVDVIFTDSLRTYCSPEKALEYYERELQKYLKYKLYERT